MGKITFVFVLVGLLSSVAMAADKGADCPAGDIPRHLGWCATDHGFNEGATCGLNALGGANVSGLPAAATQAVLGNTWDRTNMMGATKSAWKNGFKEQATDAAICCQVHNDEAHACLSNHRDLVKEWLNGVSK